MRLTVTAANSLKQYVMQAATDTFTMAIALPKHCVKVLHAFAYCVVHTLGMGGAPIGAGGHDPPHF